MGNEGKVDAITLRKLREIRGLSRKEAGVLLCVSHKSVEKFENGRTVITNPRIKQTARAYGLTYEDFLLCREGKSEQIKKRFGHKKEKVSYSKKNRRFDKKIITKEVQVLQVLRRLKNLTQYKASLICNYHKNTIGQIENGRIELYRAKIIHIVKSYGFTTEDFEYHMKSDVLVTDIQDECISIIKKLNEKKLRAVHPLLLNFKS